MLVVLPAIQLRRRTGEWPIVTSHGGAPLRTLIGWSFVVLIAAFCLWSAMFGWFGPPGLGVRSVPQWVHWSGWICIATAFVLCRVAQVQMGASWRMGIDRRRTTLVTGGLFRFSRNPIYASVLLGLLGVVLVSPSWWTFLGWLATASVLSVQVRLEERHLLDMHGACFHDYASHVGRFLPRIGRLSRG